MVRSAVAHKLFELTSNKAIKRLPAQYLKYYEELQKPEARVHDSAPETKYLDYNQDPESGFIYRVPDQPIPVFRPEQSQVGLWGGVGCVKGFSKPKFNKPRHTNFWAPTLERHLLYSDILDIHIDVVVTKRTLELIDHYHGLDSYILSTRDQDLHSKLGVSLKHKMMVALAKQDYHHQDETKRKYVTEKYKNFVMPLEEAEWHGLSVYQAIIKDRWSELNQYIDPPLKQTYAKTLLANLILEKEKEAKEKEEGKTS